MILVDVLALMSACDINLNALSLVNLIMAMGMCVEFVAHIAHAFSVGSGPGKTRVLDALSTLVGSISSGITMTKFIGICILAFSHSKLFRVYYFRMFMAVVIVGALHGLVFFPVALSYLGDFQYNRQRIDVPLVDIDYVSKEGLLDEGILDE
jgi:Niemann-Pick C1 protein